MAASKFNPYPDFPNFLTKGSPQTESPPEISKRLGKNESDESRLSEMLFSDHLLLNQRLQKSLYIGNLNNEEDITEHPSISLTGLTLEMFSKAAPNYGLDILNMDYVCAVSGAARIPPSSMIIAMIYLERLKLKNGEYLENVSPPGLFVITMLVASKFLFEDYENMATNIIWSEALNLDVKEMNALEKDFLKAIDWNVFVKSPEFYRCLVNVETKIAAYQSSLRHWMTYYDLLTLMNDPKFSTHWKNLVHIAIKTMLICTLVYFVTAVTLTSTGSAILSPQPFDVSSLLLDSLGLPISVVKRNDSLLPLDVDMNIVNEYLKPELETLNFSRSKFKQDVKSFRSSFLKRQSMFGKNNRLNLHRQCNDSKPYFKPPEPIPVILQ